MTRSRTKISNASKSPKFVGLERELRDFRHRVKPRVKPIVVSRQTTAGCFIRREARKFFLDLAVQKPVRCPTGKSLKSCPVLWRKIFRFPCRANHLYKLAPFRLIMRGGSRSSRNAGRDAVDAYRAPGRGAREADGEVVWS